jgi:hypothetical protein
MVQKFFIYLTGCANRKISINSIFAFSAAWCASAGCYLRCSPSPLYRVLTRFAPSRLVPPTCLKGGALSLSPSAIFQTCWRSCSFRSPMHSFPFLSHAPVGSPKFLAGADDVSATWMAVDGEPLNSKTIPRAPALNNGPWSAASLLPPLSRKRLRYIWKMKFNLLHRSFTL